MNLSKWIFQSTPPARGATIQTGDLQTAFGDISIHAPREGGDRISSSVIISPSRFQSTPPARGATWGFFLFVDVTHIISIHAPREGGDTLYRVLCHHAIQHFNPRPPRGGRLRIL